MYDGSSLGWYLPISSITSPSRFLRESTTTMRYCGTRTLPRRFKRILTATSVVSPWSSDGGGDPPTQVGHRVRTPDGPRAARMRGSAARRTQTVQSCQTPAVAAEIPSHTTSLSAAHPDRTCAALRSTSAWPTAGPPSGTRGSIPVAVGGPPGSATPPGSPPARAGRPAHRAPRTAGPGQEARLAAAARAVRRRDGAPAQQGGQPAAGRRPRRRGGDPARARRSRSTRWSATAPAARGYVVGMRLSNGDASAGSRRRHLPAGQPAALDVPALTAHRGRAVRAQLRPVPRQGPRAAMGRRLLDRVELRRPRGPQRHRPAPSAARRVGERHLGASSAPTGPRHSYRVAARDEQFLRLEGRVFRRNEIWRTSVDRRTGTWSASELVKRNCALVKYPPPARPGARWLSRRRARAAPPAPASASTVRSSSGSRS